MSGHELVTGPGVGGRATGHHIDAVRVGPDLSQIPRGKPDGKWRVYCHLDAEGTVLYVGCSRTIRQRQGSHKHGSPWWPQVARVSVVGAFESQRLALDVEKSLIGLIDPPNNLLRSSREAAVWRGMVETTRSRRQRDLARESA